MRAVIIISAIFAGDIEAFDNFINIRGRMSWWRA